MNPPTSPSAPRVVIVVPTGEETRGRAASDALGLPLVTDPADGDLALTWDARGWALVDPAPGAPGAVRCDLLSGTFGQRLRRGVGLEERLAKAIGLRQHPGARVLDATAGLGRDSVVAALLGCAVIACERSPVVAWLLRDGLERAAAEPALAAAVARIMLHAADAREVMAGLSEVDRPDVVIVDPMFPERRKAALVKKEMQLLHRLLGADEDPEALLAAALHCAKRRVVVKRPGGAPPLEGRRPDLVIPGKTARYDIYLAHA